jgi:acyl-[acyl-carrier-protein]-phospholipid O-acyltransferase/long-chain-fatty-acid--[acyl-carrier-protein] ligase
VRQAILYLPLKLIWRVSDGRMRKARKADVPVIYAIAHQSQMDPALMLALLPDDTLHILDEASATSGWLEPYRALARTITFNAAHVFVSRRLVRHLKGNGRLAVYFPQTVEPDARSFRLFRAVARIAARANADIVAVHVARSQFLPWSTLPEEQAPRRLFPKLIAASLEAISLETFATRGGRPPTNLTNALLDRVAEARVAATRRKRTLFTTFSQAARGFGAERTIVEDNITGTLSYKQLMIAAHVLGGRFAAVTNGGDIVGLMAPNSVGMASAFVGLQSAGCVAAMINYSAGPATAAAAVKMARIRLVVSTRAFVERAQIGDIVAAIEGAGARMIWLEDIRKDVTTFQKALGGIFWRWPHLRGKADNTAVILFTSGSEGQPKGVELTHNNLLANVAQIEARIRFSPADKLFNVLPVFHSFGLTGGTILPLANGVHILFYPSPLHFRQIPEIAAKAKPTIMFGTDTFYAAYGRAADDGDFSSLRLVVAGAEPVREETRRQWRDRFGVRIVEGYGMTEASPVVAVNTASHFRDGTVGRLLPSMRCRLEAEEGIEDAGRLWLSGPNIMRGYIQPDGRNTNLSATDDWLDTGDIVSFDNDGYLAIRGRMKRFAKIAGEMVSLAAVEVLAQELWPDARHAAIALPDPKRGERIVLVTTLAGATRQALSAFGKQRGVAEIAFPEKVLVVGEIPSLGSGKTDHAAVKRMAQSLLSS